jgi:hypothetical protein
VLWRLYLSYEVAGDETNLVSLHSMLLCNMAPHARDGHDLPCHHSEAYVGSNLL